MTYRPVTKRDVDQAHRYLARQRAMKAILRDRWPAPLLLGLLWLGTVLVTIALLGRFA